MKAASSNSSPFIRPYLINFDPIDGRAELALFRRFPMFD